MYRWHRWPCNWRISAGYGCALDRQQLALYRQARVCTVPAVNVRNILLFTVPWRFYWARQRDAQTGRALRPSARVCRIVDSNSYCCFIISFSCHSCWASEGCVCLWGMCHFCFSVEFQKKLMIYFVSWREYWPGQRNAQTGVALRPLARV